MLSPKGFNGTTALPAGPYFMMNAHLGLKELVSESVGRGRLGAGKTLEGERAVLQKLTKVEYNGRVVSVGPYDADADRYSVSLSDGTVIAVKRVNVIPAALSGASDPTPPPRCGICDVSSSIVCALSFVMCLLYFRAFVPAGTFEVRVWRLYWGWILQRGAPESRLEKTQTRVQSFSKGACGFT